MEDRTGMFWMNEDPRCLINVFNGIRIMSNRQVSYQISSDSGSWRAEVLKLGLMLEQVTKLPCDGTNSVLSCYTSNRATNGANNGNRSLHSSLE
ncbi:hypothetical protein V6N13_014686 [Hibiscus sabdariffa]|uniref:Uncharacterized protein n=1 Tax=Hibiscus sabdariffa TaxID=183260 RepID=A0ABR2RW26_9ROSI